MRKLTINGKVYTFDKLTPEKFHSIFVKLSTSGNAVPYVLEHDEGVILVPTSGVVIEGPIGWNKEVKPGSKPAVEAADAERNKAPSHTLTPGPSPKMIKEKGADASKAA